MHINPRPTNYIFTEEIPRGIRSSSFYSAITRSTSDHRDILNRLLNHPESKRDEIKEENRSDLYIREITKCRLPRVYYNSNSIGSGILRRKLIGSRRRARRWWGKRFQQEGGLVQLRTYSRCQSVNVRRVVRFSRL